MTNLIQMSQNTSASLLLIVQDITNLIKALQETPIPFLLIIAGLIPQKFVSKVK